jgi:hypothetical protein
MSHAEIVAELPNLSPEERQDIYDRLRALQARELGVPDRPSEAEKRLLDQEWEDYQRDKNTGTPWREVMAELRARSKR